MPKETFFNLDKEKQENVMRAAINEFSLHGFEKGNIGNMAKNAGVSKGSMYQYFENKKELFLYCVKWSAETVQKKYQKYFLFDKDINLFEYLYESSKAITMQIREERILVIFIQDVFLGKYRSVMDESMDYILKFSEEYILRIIHHGKENGYIRKDIDDQFLCLFVMGVSFKFKEVLMNKARTLGEDVIDEPFEAYEKEVGVMIELMKNGMAGGIR